MYLHYLPVDAIDGVKVEMNIDKSISFINTRGTEIEKARMNYILHGIRPAPKIHQSLYELQNVDGGFPFGMQRGNLSTINETTVALWWLEELDLLDSPAANQALDYLLRTQKTDGSWDEDPRLAQYKLPHWIKLNDLSTRLYLSAYAAYWLAVSGMTCLPAFRQALHFLIRSQDKTGKVFGYPHTTWISSAVFLLAGQRYSSIASQGVIALSNRPMYEWEDSQLAWALDCLSKGGLNKHVPFVKSCLQELSNRQKSNGSWASEDGVTSAVSATLQAVKVLKHYGVMTVSKEG
jgi:hypothetical protein